MIATTAVLLRDHAPILTPVTLARPPFASHRLSWTIRDLAAAGQVGMTSNASDSEETARKIAECNAKLAQYHAALDAGASLATVAAWIADTEPVQDGSSDSVRGALSRKSMHPDHGVRA